MAGKQCIVSCMIETAEFNWMYTEKIVWWICMRREAFNEIKLPFDQTQTRHFFNTCCSFSPFGRLNGILVQWEEFHFNLRSCCHWWIRDSSDFFFGVLIKWVKCCVHWIKLPKWLNMEWIWKTETTLTHTHAQHVCAGEKKLHLEYHARQL